jgi:hypothetical protein
MIRDREQPLNPPGIDAPDRKIIRQYIPMREYAVDRFANTIYAEAEVEESQKDETVCSKIEGFSFWDEAAQMLIQIPPMHLSATPKDCTETLQTIIEREICRHAALLPCTTWEVEYEGD